MLHSSSTFVQGLYVMLVGMGVVFAALFLVMLAIMLLDRVFRPKEVAEEEAVEAAPAIVSAPVVAAPQVAASGADQGLVAAIALGLALRIQETEQAPAPARVRVISVQDVPSLWAAVGKLQ